MVFQEEKRASRVKTARFTVYLKRNFKWTFIATTEPPIFSHCAAGEAPPIITIFHYDKGD